MLLDQMGRVQNGKGTEWEGYRIEHNSWEPVDDVHAPECVTEFHQNHPGAPHHIWFMLGNANYGGSTVKLREEGNRCDQV